MKGYRTILFNVLMAIAGAVLVWKQIEIPQAMVEEAATGGVAFWALGNLILRALTTTKIGQKE